MAGKSIHLPEVICLDGEFIDTGEIANVSNPEPYQRKDSEKQEFVFFIQYKGHSNKLAVISSTQDMANLKRFFVVEKWTAQNIEEIDTFDETAAREQMDEDGPNYYDEENEN